MLKIAAFFILFAFSVNVNAQTKRDSIINYAKSLVGVPYNYGGCSATGFDCSGFVYHVFKKFKQSVPRVSSAYNKYKEKQDLKDCKPADIIVFTGTNSAVKKPGHVGIVLNNNDGVIDFIHASSSKKHYGVTITRYNASGYVKRFLFTLSVLPS